MQQTDLGLNLSLKKTRKREFLEQMQQVVVNQGDQSAIEGQPGTGVGFHLALS